MLSRCWLLCAGLAVILAEQGQAACSITGDATITCDGVVYQAVDDECVHYVDLAAHQAAHPGVPLPSLKKTVAANYADPTIIQPVLVALTDYVDCTGASHGFSDANIVPTSRFPNWPSRLMDISGKTFRVTAAPTDGFATYYFSYDLAAGGTAGVPHLLVVESSNDQERYTSVAIHHPDGISTPTALPYAPPYAGEPTNNPWGTHAQNIYYTEQEWVFGPDVGVASYTGRELPIDHQPFNISLLFHPKTAQVRVVVSSLGCNAVRGPDDGGAASQMWAFQFVDAMSSRFPAMALPAEAGKQRRIGIYMTHPWYFYSHYGAPARLLGHRQEGLRRLVRHLRYCGLNYIVFNAINGSDLSRRAWYSGSTYFSWNRAGDLLAELPPIAQAEGIELVPLITSLMQPYSTGGLTFTTDSYQMGTDGGLVNGSLALDPLRPEVQQLTRNTLAEMAARTAASPAVRGLGIRVNGKMGTCYIARDAGRGARFTGYSAWDLEQFKNDTGSAVPVSPPSDAYSYLAGHSSEWEAWIDWRCRRTRDFWLSCRDLIKSYRPDWTLYVQCDLPSECPGTNVEWPAGTTPLKLLRHHGYDPDLFAADTGIVISRGMMVALDRAGSESRWGGGSSLGYRTFHYAPGLAELYRTAEGKACEFYQTYWEETFNPYYEFGSPGDPNGFFRTHTPAAPRRAFFAGAAMSMRRQDPDAMTWLGWNRPTLGHESDLRKFAQAFRALPAVAPQPFDGSITPNLPDEVVARWYEDRLAVINDSPTVRTIALQAVNPIPTGGELVDVVTGRKLVAINSAERRQYAFNAEAYSLNTFCYSGPPRPSIDFTVGPNPTEQPYTVSLTDVSSGSDLGERSWDFGGLGTAVGTSVTYTFPLWGTYDVTLRVWSAGQVFSVTRSVAVGTPIPADMDRDGDVDQEDFGRFQVCFNTPGVYQTDPACQSARLDGDADVDQDDLVQFRIRYTGPAAPYYAGGD